MRIPQQGILGFHGGFLSPAAKICEIHIIGCGTHKQAVISMRSQYITANILLLNILAINTKQFFRTKNIYLIRTIIVQGHASSTDEIGFGLT